MVQLKATDASEFELIDEGDVVNVRLNSVVAKAPFEYEGKTIEKLRWEFTITDQGQWYGKTIQGETSTAFTAHPNCKAYAWVGALTGRKYTDGEGLDTDTLVGMPGRVIVGHRPGKDGRVWMQVRDVLPGKTKANFDLTTADEQPF